MPTSDIDRYANNGDFRFLQIKGIYYQWRIGIGWSVIDKTKVPETINWSVLQPAQRAVFEPELPK